MRLQKIAYAENPSASGSQKVAKSGYMMLMDGGTSSGGVDPDDR
jgi:hypothetical protein